MLSQVGMTIKPLLLNKKVIEAAYELYLQAPQADYPVICLKKLSQKTGASLLDCRNAIVEAHRLGRFPQCSLHS